MPETVLRSFTCVLSLLPVGTPSRFLSHRCGLRGLGRLEHPCSLNACFSASTLLTFGHGQFFVVGRSCPTSYRMFRATLTSTHEMPGVPPTPSWDNQKCLQILSHVSWWQNGPRVRSLDLSFSHNVPGLQNREDEQGGSGLAFLGHLTYIVYQGSMQEFTCYRIPRLEGCEIHSSD